MRLLKELFENNRRWADEMARQDPGFFERLFAQQSPELLWIGCSDSRVPANQITGLPPGAVFVHRNIANVVRQDDPNCLAVLQYAIDVLKVKHVLVVGHYRCGGVKAALEGEARGTIGDWLQPVQELVRRHESALAACLTAEQRWDRMCELNVIEHALAVARTAIVREAWQRGQDVAVHGWIYSVRDGLLRDLGITITGPEEHALADTTRRIELLTPHFVSPRSK